MSSARPHDAGEGPPGPPPPARCYGHNRGGALRPCANIGQHGCGHDGDMPVAAEQSWAYAPARPTGGCRGMNLVP